MHTLINFHVFLHFQLLKQIQLILLFLYIFVGTNLKEMVLLLMISLISLLLKNGKKGKLMEGLLLSLLIKFVFGGYGKIISRVDYAVLKLEHIHYTFLFMSHQNSPEDPKNA